MAFVRPSAYGGRSQSAKRQLANSITAVVGEVFKSYDQDGRATHGVAATPILGILMGIVDESGNPIFSSTITAGTAKSANVTSQATGTGGAYYGLFEVSRFAKFSAEVSGTLGTTNYSDQAGSRLDVDSANTSYGRLLELTSTNTIGTPANFYSHGLDRNNSARLMVTIAMSELDSVME